MAVSAYSQDMLILRTGDTLKVNVTKSGNNTVEYTFSGETLVNEKSKKELKQIVYASGRVEDCNASFQLPVINGKGDWEKVVVTYLPSDVEGLTRVADLKASSGWGGVVAAGGYNNCIKSLKKQAAKKGACVVLITGQPNSMATAMGAGSHVRGIAYK